MEIFFSNSTTVRRVDNFLDINPQLLTIPIKKCTLTMSSVFQQENLKKPTIIIIRRNRKLMLLKTITEAFSLLGYNVITIQFRTKINIKTNRITSELKKELYETIPSIIKFYNNEVDLVKKNCNVIDFNRRLIPYNYLLKNSDCRDLILINPLLNSHNLELMLTILKEFKKYPQLITIFSKNLNPIFKNRKIEKIFMKNEAFKNTQRTIIQKAKSTFKNYETILLSVVIRYIEK